MALHQKLRSDLAAALLEKEELRIWTLRLLLAAVHNKEIEERKKDVGLADDEIFLVIRQEAKKRHDAISEYTKGRRDDLVRRETIELKILEEYLPPELSDEEIVRVIREGIREVEPAGLKDFGALMKVIMPSLKGRASGERISLLVRKTLRQS